MAWTLTRATLGRLYAHSSAPIAGIETAFNSGHWTGSGNLTFSVVSSRLRAVHAAAAAAASRYFYNNQVAVRSNVHMQQVWHASNTDLLRSGPMARIAVAGTFPADCIFCRNPNNAATGTNRNLTLNERTGGAQVQTDTAGPYTPNLPQRTSLMVRGSDAAFYHFGLAERLTLAGIALLTAGRIGMISSNDSASSSVTTELSAAYAATDSILTVNGPAIDSWYVAILDALDNELATAPASGGVAEIDFDTENIPYPDARKIEIRSTSDDTVFIAVDGADLLDSKALWGGDVWTFTGEVPPETPATPTLSSLVGRRALICTDPVEGATSYKLLRGDSELGPFVQVASGPNPCLSNTAPLAQETYFYVMRACNDSGCSGVSEALEVETTIAPCTLELEVFEADGETVAWRVTTDAGLPFPYLDRPSNYGARELDPVRGAAIISTVSVSVRDVPQTPGDQDSGFVTERLGTIYGRRCRLFLYPTFDATPVLIADGPAATPRLAADYSSYTFEIRDTRETEKKLQPFRDSATISMFPFGPVDDWGPLDAIVPITARCDHSVGGGFVNVTLVPTVGAFFATTLNEEQVQVVRPQMLAQLPSSGGGRAIHDVLWRISGSGDPWSQIYPALIIIGAPSIAEFDDEGRCASVALAQVLDGFPALLANLPAHNDVVEFYIRYRGKPSADLPAYFEGTLGELLAGVYDRSLEQVAPEATVYDLYELAPLPLTDLLPVRVDAAAIAALTEPVLLRQVAPIEDGRDWAEVNLYAPSGWIPALDLEGRISPVSRNRPDVVSSPQITAAIAQPSPDWNAGERIVTQVILTAHRYYLPADPVIDRGADGVATREVEKKIIDLDAQDRHGDLIEEFDARAFSVIGDTDGNALVAGAETVDDLALAAEDNVLGRYAGGAPAVVLLVKRDEVSALREGDFVEVLLPWMPGEGPARGLDWSAAQILLLEESDCAWRKMLIERCPLIGDS